MRFNWPLNGTFGSIGASSICRTSWLVRSPRLNSVPHVDLPFGIGYALIQFWQAYSKKSSHGSIVSDNDDNIFALIFEMRKTGVRLIKLNLNSIHGLVSQMASLSTGDDDWSVRDVDSKLSWELERILIEHVH